MSHRLKLKEDEILLKHPLISCINCYTPWIVRHSLTVLRLRLGIDLGVKHLKESIGLVAFQIIPLVFEEDL